MTNSIPSSTLEKFTTFGDLLRFLRRRAGITQMDLATAVGYSDAQISRLEQNLRLPDIPTIQARFVTALDLEDEPNAVARLLDLAASVRREDAPVLGLCPYKGLNFFDETDADLFIGRESLTAKLTERLLSLASNQPPDAARFLAVVGASGSGKSSLVRAGCVPSVRWNKSSSDWNIHVLTPTGHPLESLAMTLTQESSSVVAAARLMDDLAGDPRSLHLFAKREIKSSNVSRLLLVVDQFEELFALCRSEEERSAFIGNLLMAATEVDGPTIVLITLRADFYAHCAGYTQLREALAQQQEYIGVMSDDEMRRAIEDPARRGRWEFEPGLVELLLHDVGHEPGALPLLSHALFETWQRRRGRAMTLSGYTSSGGVRGAIAETAEAVFSDQFTVEQRAIARRIFLRLTELGEETATGDTRRRATFTELILKPEDADTTQAVLKTLADARLIITSENSAEVSHEALIREWPTLRGWLEDNREGLRLHRHLTEVAQEWADLEHAPDVLYRGARLAQALEWSSSHQDEMNALEREFLEAAQDLAECEANEKEAQRQRELAAAQKLADAERMRAEEQARAARQLRKRAIYLTVAFIFAALMALTAGVVGRQAQSASRIAASRELASASISNLELDPERSLLLAMEAISTTYTLEAEEALHQSILASRVRQVIPAYEPGASTSVSFSPDGKSLATASQDEVVKAWDSTTGKQLFTTSGHSAAYSPDGKRLATVLADGSIALRDAATGEQTPLAGHIDGSAGAAFSPDGSRLATITSGNLPRIWEIATGRELVSMPGHSDFISTATFSPDGKRLLTASDDGTARLWDANTGKELLRLSGHPGWVWSAVFSPDGSRIATVSKNEAMLWDATSGEKLFTLTGHRNTIYSAAFSPDGFRLATGGLDRKVMVWDVSTGQEEFTLAGHTGAITGLAFSPDGTRLVSASDDGTLRVWDVLPSHERRTFYTPGSLSGQISFSPDGISLAGSQSNAVKIWDVESGQELHALPGNGLLVSALAYSPDGKRLATADNDSIVILWDVSSGKELNHWPAHTGWINAITFNPEGTLLATASDDYKIKFWDVSTPVDPDRTDNQPSFSFDLQKEIKSLAFSPDGTMLAAGLQSGTGKIFDLVSRKEIISIPGHTDSIMSTSFNPMGDRLATASLDGTVKIWDATSGDEVLTLGGHTDAVTAVVFSPDGKRIATSSRDGTAKVWDAATGQELLTFNQDGAVINSIAFSPDGELLATSSDDGVRIYLLNVKDLVSLARTRMTRSLTSEECLKYLHRVSGACASPAPIPMATPMPPAAQGRICQVTNTSGLHDSYFNELLFKGLQDSSRLFGWETNVLQSASTADFEKNIRAFLGADCKLIVSPGNLVEAMQEVAETSPDQKFMLTDFVPDTSLENVWSQVYATDQAAFLAGYVAAATTKTGKVGLFGGVDIPQVTDFMDGFTLGVAYYNEKNGANIEVIGWDVDKHAGLFVGSFCCTTEGRSLARQLMEAGADVILPVAGESVGWGAGAEVKEHGNAWFIGVDTDWAVTSPELADIVLTSIEKRYDVSVVQAARSIAEGAFTGGIHTGLLETGEVNISPFHTLDKLVSAKIKADLEQIRADIIAGKIHTKP